MVELDDIDVDADSKRPTSSTVYVRIEFADGTEAEVGFGYFTDADMLAGLVNLMGAKAGSILNVAKECLPEEYQALLTNALKEIPS